MQVQEAYDTLGDAEKRTQYDLKLAGVQVLSLARLEMRHVCAGSLISRHTNSLPLYCQVRLWPAWMCAYAQLQARQPHLPPPTSSGRLEPPYWSHIQFSPYPHNTPPLGSLLHPPPTTYHLSHWASPSPTHTPPPGPLPHPPTPLPPGLSLTHPPPSPVV